MLTCSARIKHTTDWTCDCAFSKTVAHILNDVILVLEILRVLLSEHKERSAHIDIIFKSIKYLESTTFLVGLSEHM